MKADFSVEEAVGRRYSVRSYDSRAVDEDTRIKLLSYAQSLQNPLGPPIRVQFIEKTTAANGEKLGTYGFIRGATLYLGVTVPRHPHAMEAVGYDFEQLVLYATSLGLGTCWLGGTFRRSAFARAMEIREEELFPILSPLGYPKTRPRSMEQLFRRALKADDRLPWEKLFFHRSFDTPLSREDAGAYAFPLDMLRRAPSAVNGQPWRVVADGSAFHFYQKAGGDMQRIDMGIALCHFHLAAQERALPGRLERCAPNISAPTDMSYLISWIAG